MNTQTGVVNGAAAKAREVRRRMREAGVATGETQTLAAIFDLHLRLQAVEARLAAQPPGRAKRDAD